MAHHFFSTGDYGHLGKYYTDPHGFDVMVCAYHGREICNMCCVDHKYPNDLMRKEHGIPIAREGLVVDVSLLHDGSEDEDDRDDCKEEEEDEGGCRVCRRSVAGLKTCSACRMAWYCSTDCQKRDWTRGHRIECKKWRASGGGEGGGGSGTTGAAASSSSSVGRSEGRVKRGGVSVGQVRDYVRDEFVKFFDLPFLIAAIEIHLDVELERRGKGTGEAVYETKAREDGFKRSHGRDRDENGLDYHSLLNKAVEYRYKDLDKCLRFVVLAADDCLKSLGKGLRACCDGVKVFSGGKEVTVKEEATALVVGRFIAAVLLKNMFVAHSGYVQQSGDFMFVVKLLKDCAFILKDGFAEQAEERAGGNGAVRSECCRILECFLMRSEIDEVLLQRGRGTKGRFRFGDVFSTVGTEHRPRASIPEALSGNVSG